MRLIQSTCLVLITLLATLPCQASAQRSTPDERMIMKSVAVILEQAHISGKQPDDEISRLAFDAWFDSLDPLRIYFEKKDIEGFMSQRDDLDDMLLKGNVGFALKSFELFRDRVNQRFKTIETFLAPDATFDFDLDEHFVTKRDKLQHPETPTEARDMWRRRLKHNLLSLHADEVAPEEARDRLLRRFTRFRDDIRRETRDDIVARFINTLSSCFDPHTNYMSPKVFEDFNMTLTLNYQGIGALLFEEDGYVMIRRVLPGGAVEKQGLLKANDKILAVGQGKDGPMVDIVGMRVSDAVKHIRGEGGTIVRLSIQPHAGGPKVVHQLTRARIELEESAATAETFEVPMGKGAKPCKVGVIGLDNFYRDTKAARQGKKDFRSSTRDVRRILETFTKEGVDAVVLDLSRNGGGFLPEAVGISGLFIDRGPVVQVKGSRRRARTLRDRDRGMSWDGPLIILVSQGSASASEIVAGAIKDYHRGLIVGDSTTHGKGTVQSPIDIADVVSTKKDPGSLGILKTTIQKFYRPNGESTQLRGVPADVAIPSWTDVMEIGESDVPFALPFDAIRPTTHMDHAMVDKKITAELTAASSKRLDASKHFQELGQRLQTYLEFKARNRVPLKRDKYMEMQKSLTSDEKVAEEVGKEKDRSADPWFSEVLSITADYIRMLQRRDA